MITQIIVAITIIFIILYLVPFKSLRKKKPEIQSFTDFKSLPNISWTLKPYIWIYMEEQYNTLKWPSFGSRITLGNTESYVQLCLYSLYKHCHSDFNIKIVHPQNIKKYLPDLSIDMGPNSTIDLHKRIDLISFMLLYQYGGVWMTPNTIVLKSLKPFHQLLQKCQLVVMGSPPDYYRQDITYLKPARNFMVARPRLKIMKLCASEISKMITSYNYPGYTFDQDGNCVFWKFLKQSVYFDNLELLHLKAEFDGTRDYQQRLITNQHLFSQNQTRFLNDQRVSFVSLNHTEIQQKIEYKWFLRMSIYQILNSSLWIGYLFRQALEIRNKYYYANNFNTNLPREPIQVPPVNIKKLDQLLYNSNYFSTAPWDTVYNQ